MSTVAAWLMQIDRLTRVAVAQMELVHILPDPEYIEVPKAPDHCKRVVIWNKLVIPVVDISMLIHDVSSFYQNNAVAITIYHNPDDNQYYYAGIQLTDMPVLENVSNAQYVSASEVSAKWRSFTISAFRSKDNDVVPVLDVPRLFAADFGFPAG